MLARKWRPLKFAEVIGQNKVIQTLQNAIKNQKIGNAYLFSGPRGIGKTTIARIFARAINCLNLSQEIEPCNECSSCRAFLENRSLNIYEIDAASHNQVDNIRELIEHVKYYPTDAKYKVYIIDEVHMLSQAAFNAFLKTLEEPPSYAVFILATTEKHKVLPTIISRCQVFQFARIHINEVIKRLKLICENENISASESALRLIAHASDGILRDAITSLEVIANAFSYNFSEEDVRNFLGLISKNALYELIESIENCKWDQIVKIVDDLYSRGHEPSSILNEIFLFYRDLALFIVNSYEISKESISPDYLDFLKQKATNYNIPNLIDLIEFLSRSINEKFLFTNPKVWVEVVFLTLSQKFYYKQEQGKPSQESKIKYSQTSTNIITTTKSSLPQKEIGNKPILGTSSIEKLEAATLSSQETSFQSKFNQEITANTPSPKRANAFTSHQLQKALLSILTHYNIPNFQEISKKARLHKGLTIYIPLPTSYHSLLSEIAKKLKEVLNNDFIEVVLEGDNVEEDNKKVENLLKEVIQKFNLKEVELE